MDETGVSPILCSAVSKTGPGGITSDSSLQGSGMRITESLKNGPQGRQDVGQSEPVLQPGLSLVSTLPAKSDSTILHGSAELSADTGSKAGRQNLAKTRRRNWPFPPYVLAPCVQH